MAASAVAAVAAVAMVVAAGPEGVRRTGRTVAADPFSLVSRTELIETVAELAAVGEGHGWRNSASSGEAAAFDLVERRLAELRTMAAAGLEVERQQLRVHSGTEVHEVRLELDLGRGWLEVPASTARGPRDALEIARRFDSDGWLDDLDPNPVDAEGETAAVVEPAALDGLAPASLAGRVALVDFALVDRSILADETAVARASRLLAAEPAAVVLVTSFSNRPGESHGAFANDESAFNRVVDGGRVPLLVVRLEDLAPIGLETLDDLAQAMAARCRWDVDVVAPGRSETLTALAPGRDRSRAVVLGAHIDSPMSPGALDDGSGSAVLLEVARVLDASRHRPPVDLVLVWFGSEELGLYGSYHWAGTHQELLDRTLAMLNVDCLTRPLDGIPARLTLVTWPFGRFGDGRLTWPDTLADLAADRGVTAHPEAYYGIESDSTAFAGFDVPHANLIHVNSRASAGAGGVHYAGHLHSPYDTVERVVEMAGVLESMTRIALSAALDSAGSAAGLRVTPPSDRRAVFVASHTEPVQMSPTTFTDLGMALAWEGFDVDLVPYGRALSAGDLADADLVVALPVVDYPSPEGDSDPYDESWSEAELDLLESYARSGGRLVVAASAHRLKYFNRVLDGNEDQADQAVLAARFGVGLGTTSIAGDEADRAGGHALMDGVPRLELAPGNALPLSGPGVVALARAGGSTVAALVPAGAGEVVVLGDVGILSSAGEASNLRFWTNLARWAR